MQTLSENPKVAIYARVSTEEQREGQTIDSQVSELERFARDKGWDVAGIYKDEGWSGSVLARPELDRLRDHASVGRFNFNSIGLRGHPNARPRGVRRSGEV